MDLPTYTNIWRIEKRLYKLYDFRLPAPLPITWIAVFAGITVPYVVFLVAVGLPFNHNVVWLYVLPPGVLTWLTTRPVIESKRLPELVTSQLKYLAEPRTWCRMAPFAEKDEILFIVRVWHRHPPQPPRRPRALPGPPGRSPARVRRARAAHQAPAAAVAAAAARPGAPSIAPAPALPAREPAVREPAVREPVVREPPVRQAPEEAAPLRAARTEATAARAATPPAQVRMRQRATARPASPERGRGRGLVRRPARQAPSPGRTTPDPRTLEVTHDADPGSRDPGTARPVPPGRPSWPSLPAGDAVTPGSVPEPGRLPATGPSPGPERLPGLPPRAAAGAPARHETPAHVTPARSIAARVAASFLDLDSGERPLPSVRRAVSGPDSRGEETWRRRVKVVTGGHGPDKRDRETLDRDRARLPLPGPRRIVVLGCAAGAGQTVTAMMTGRLLAAIRDVPVAAVDLNPGPAGLSARAAPVASVTALLAAASPREVGARAAARLHVIAGPDGTRALDADGYRRLADLLAKRYPLTLIDPAPAELTRVLTVASQLLLVAPASPAAATSLASTQQWLTAHGYHELAARAVTVINGVSGRVGQDVLEAESVARGRCRAIVRVPWDDRVSARRSPSAKAGPAPALQPQTRIAYTALAGVLVAGLAALPAPPDPGGNSGELTD